MREYGLSLTCILPYDDKIYDFVLTSSFSDKERAAVLGQSAEISESEIYFPLIRIIKSKKKKLALTLFYCLGQET